MAQPVDNGGHDPRTMEGTIQRLVWEDTTQSGKGTALPCPALHDVSGGMRQAVNLKFRREVEVKMKGPCFLVHLYKSIPASEMMIGEPNLRT
jgi:hypothetical protein